MSEAMALAKLMKHPAAIKAFGRLFKNSDHMAKRIAELSKKQGDRG